MKKIIACADPKANYLAHRAEIDAAVRRVMRGGELIAPIPHRLDSHVRSEGDDGVLDRSGVSELLLERGFRGSGLDAALDDGEGGATGRP